MQPENGPQDDEDVDGGGVTVPGATDFILDTTDVDAAAVANTPNSGYLGGTAALDNAPASIMVVVRFP